MSTNIYDGKKNLLGDDLLPVFPHLQTALLAITVSIQVTKPCWVDKIRLIQKKMVFKMAHN